MALLIVHRALGWVKFYVEIFQGFAFSNVSEKGGRTKARPYEVNANDDVYLR